MLTARKSYILIILVIMTIGIFYISTIRGGHYWGDDFSMYIHHAKNIVEGKPYRDTGYLFNPYAFFVGPRSYPPIFPLLLTPVYAYFGINLNVTKAEIIIFFVLFLILMPLIFKDWFTSPFLILLILLVGVNPYFWDFKDNVLSDIPFLFFIYLTLFLISQYYQSPVSNKLKYVYILLISLFLFLSIGTRTVGFIIIPCLFIYDLLINKKPSKFAISIYSILLVFLVLEVILFPREGGYLEVFSLSLKIIVLNIYGYTKLLTTILYNGYNYYLAIVLSLIVNLLSGWGYWVRIKKRVTICELFLPLYMCVLFVCPWNAGIRLLIPIIPLYFAYFLVGLCSLRTHIHFLGMKGFRVLSVLLVAAIMVSYVARYTSFDFGPIKEGITKEESQQLFKYIRDNTQVDDIIVFWKPRALALFTGRRSSAYHRPEKMSELLIYFSNIGTTHVVVRRNDNFLIHLICTFPDHFQETFSNADFQVFRFRPHNL